MANHGTAVDRTRTGRPAPIVSRRDMHIRITAQPRAHARTTIAAHACRTIDAALRVRPTGGNSSTFL